MKQNLHNTLTVTNTKQENNMNQNHTSELKQALANTGTALLNKALNPTVHPIEATKKVLSTTKKTTFGGIKGFINGALEANGKKIVDIE